MQRKKSGFLTFICSLVPGAGEMYMGFFKQGASIMILFAVCMMLGALTGLGIVSVFMPILWAYSFFHTHHLRSMQDEEFYALEDRYLFDTQDGKINEWIHTPRAKKYLAAALIIIGICALWNTGTSLLGSRLGAGYYDSFFYNFVSNVPEIVVAILMILIGIRLISGKKTELNKEMEAGQQTTESQDPVVYDVPSTPELPVQEEVKEKEGDSNEKSA